LEGVAEYGLGSKGMKGNKKAFCSITCLAFARLELQSIKCISHQSK
jgi:hypothetical protein